MRRRDFIKKLTGLDQKSIIVWAAVLTLVVILLKFNFSDSATTVGRVAILAGWLLLIYAALVIAVSLLAYIIRKISGLLPVNFLAWLQKNNSIIAVVIIVAILAYPVYNLIEKGNYFQLILSVIIFCFSYLFRDRKEPLKAEEALKNNSR